MQQLLFAFQLSQACPDKLVAVGCLLLCENQHARLSTNAVAAAGHRSSLEQLWVFG